MKPIIKSIILVTGCFLSHSIFGCTSFGIAVTDGMVVGKAFQWVQERGYAIVNKRNIRKKAILPMGVTASAASWASKYGSVSFNQVGQDFPFEGANEQSLSVQTLVLGSSIPGPIDDRPVVTNIQWVQYQLDNFASVREVIEHASEIHLEMVGRGTHYLVCDPSECAVFEHVSGNLVISHGSNFPVAVITNNTYEDSLSYLGEFEGFGGTRSIPSEWSSDSLDRFVIAADHAQRVTSDVGVVEKAFNALGAAGTPFTMWESVFDSRQSILYFRTLNKPKIKRVSISSFDYSCLTPALALSLTTSKSADVTTQFVPLTWENNASMVRFSLRRLERFEIISSKERAYYEQMLAESAQAAVCEEGE